MADTEPSKTTKRRLKAPSQTVRQQAEKGQAEADKPQGQRRLRAAAAQGRKPFARASKAFDRQPFRLFGRILFPRFARSAFTELRLVTWPNFRETRQLTFAVIAFAVVFGIMVTIVDYGLDKLFKAIILK